MIIWLLVIDPDNAVEADIKYLAFYSESKAKAIQTQYVDADMGACCTLHRVNVTDTWALEKLPYSGALYPHIPHSPSALRAIEPDPLHDSDDFRDLGGIGVEPR